MEKRSIQPRHRFPLPGSIRASNRRSRSGGRPGHDDRRQRRFLVCRQPPRREASLDAVVKPLALIPWHSNGPQPQSRSVGAIHPREAAPRGIRPGHLRPKHSRSHEEPAPPRSTVLIPREPSARSSKMRVKSSGTLSAESRHDIPSHLGGKAIEQVIRHHPPSMNIPRVRIQALTGIIPSSIEGRLI